MRFDWQKGIDGTEYAFLGESGLEYMAEVSPHDLDGAPGEAAKYVLLKNSIPLTESKKSGVEDWDITILEDRAADMDEAKRLLEEFVDRRGLIT